MGHQHQHQHHAHEHATGNIKVAFFLNLGFTIVEFLGGFYTNSLAIMSDAIHDLGDSLSLGMSWYFQKLSTKKANDRFSYGYGRFSLLGAVINSVVLIVGAILIIKEAIPRIIKPEASDAQGMMWFAILGILVNGAAVLKLKKGSSINERVVSLHLLEDVLGWVAVLLASIIMQFWNLPMIDPILSLLIALFILFNVVRNIKGAFKILLQAVPNKLDTSRIKKALLTFDAIESIHDCHVWSLDGTTNIASIHIQLDSIDPNWQTIVILKEQVRKLLHDEFHLEHITLEFERLDEDCSYKDCN